MSEANNRSPIRLGMVGGGQGAFIGAVHRIAARIDGDYQLVAGALSSDAERARLSAVELGLDSERSYASFEAMAKAEAARADGIEAVSIVTPNHVHFPAAKAFLEAGIHVICDKPVTASLDEAKALEKIIAQSGKLFVLTHNYTGYPMVRQARAMIGEDLLGPVRLVQAEYAQDWLTTKAEAAGSKQAEWRTDPKRSGAGGAIGDIGTHAYNLACFVSGLEADQLAADLSSFVPGRVLDDNAHIMLRFKKKNGTTAKGMIWASQVAPGNENTLKLRIYGEKGGLEWAQEDPNRLWFTPFGEAKRLITRGSPQANHDAQRITRVPAGHPEGYLEGFATIYAEAARAIRAARDNAPVSSEVVYPTIADGVAGVAFVEACVTSSRADAAWTKL
ncbi:Gfo/Idh/MocA family oxidoreductase [Ochrobactrum sp. CM-21-5]|nr:Gfo/Idh/MocA family oxidoreductase [Ochrobactrum sp. CM-21-5]MBC2884124.1 Gfo/Idh/MocA family oxidoreductase [Ochrobactrum sp. CM-21-5]